MKEKEEDYFTYVQEKMDGVKEKFGEDEWAWPTILEKVLRPFFYFKEEGQRDIPQQSQLPTEETHAPQPPGSTATSLDVEALMTRMKELVEGHTFDTPRDFGRFAGLMRDIFGEDAKGNQVYRVWKNLRDRPEDLITVHSLLQEMGYVE